MMKLAMITAAFMLLSSSVNAAQAPRYECTSGSQIRVIQVVYSNPESSVPCTVEYTKQGASQVLWQAEGQQGYCEEKAHTFMQKQQGWGWNCSQTGADTTVASQQESSTHQH